jgi:uncharacterized protein YecE (DUF72 family)
MKNWKYKIKNNFKLSIKANKIITHTSKLKNLEKLKEFLETVSILNEMYVCYSMILIKILFLNTLQILIT